MCGEDLTAEYGSISSPGFPGKYPTNRDCYWNINVAPGKRIALNFISVMLEEHPTCRYDYLEVNIKNIPLYVVVCQLRAFVRIWTGAVRGELVQMLIANIE